MLLVARILSSCQGSSKLLHFHIVNGNLTFSRALLSRSQQKLKQNLAVTSPLDPVTTVLKLPMFNELSSVCEIISINALRSVFIFALDIILS